ncbi:SulP family inorganic anion transporter [Bradyrhizobium huanghuaihaiense]|uniref:SulP family inorganic anion transporter n=1 Tax=Bradyrhizobium huanghuaihaiense TaxID=990078 RepID=UPI0021AAED2C|nr:SulP family inorganic anion transporter [Bradyrhizobium sp. CB3035]UWU77987.1 SulP family inorganic anion transporter [Bradyrhizobium sp. CB3035]
MSGFAVTRGDIFGGITAGIVALPLCLAFGVASGLGPAAGLYGGIILGIVAAVVGGTPVQISGPTAPMTLIAASIVAANTSSDGTLQLAPVVGIFCLAGALQVAFGVARLGNYIRFLPYPAISGLMTGIGIIIIIQQIFPIAGLQSPSSSPAEILKSLGALTQGARLDAVLLAAATVAISFLLPRFFSAVPPSLVALILLTGLAVALGLSAPTIGDIPKGLPDFVLPQLKIADLRFVFVTAFQLAFLGAIDALTTSLAADNMTRTHHDSNRELIGQGAGNIGAALFGGIPGAGAFMRTAINVRAGGRHRSSGVIHGLFLLAVLLGLSSVVRYIPHAVLSGILVSAGLSIIDYRSLGHLFRAPRGDTWTMLIVVVLTIFTDLITAVGTGAVLASLIFMTKIARTMEQSTTLTLVEDELWQDELEIPDALKQGLLIKHVNGPLFFGFVYAFRRIAERAADGKMLVLRMERVTYMDQSGIYALQDVLVDLEAAGLKVFLVGLPRDQIDQLKALHIVPDLLSEEDIFQNFESFKQRLPAIVQELSRASDAGRPMKSMGF